MPIFVLIHDSRSDTDTEDTVDVNNKLKKLQNKGAEIIDVKVKIPADDGNKHRTYIITYKATIPIY